MLTPTEKAQRVAHRVVLVAEERKAVITRALVAEVVETLKAEGRSEEASAHPRTLMASVRNYAKAYNRPIALTGREVQLMWRSVFRHLSKDQGFALKEKLFAEQPELEDDADFVHAFSVAYFPKNCATAWTHYPSALAAWGQNYAWEFVTGTEGIAR